MKRKVAWVVSAVVTFGLVCLAVVAGVRRYEHKQQLAALQKLFQDGSGNVRQTTEPTKNAPAATSQLDAERDQYRSLIRGHSQFDVCRTRELRFYRISEVGTVAPEDFDNRSEFSEEYAIHLLNSAGYIEGLYPSGNNNAILWTPSAKVQSAIGHDIRQEKSDQITYVWKLTLGCREFEQIDAITQLADGAKADFSWHWNVTSIGTADRLSRERQRGVAYFTRASTGLNIDQIEFGSANAP